MRRWLLWSGGVVAVLAAVLAVALVLGREGPPFEFLEGREALALAAWVRQENEKYGVQSRLYVFKGDYNAVHKAARAELEAKRFNAHTGESKVTFEKEGLGFLEAPKPENGPWQVLTIWEDVKMNGALTKAVADGWVSVEVHGPGEDGWWDRVRSFFGL
jgi:hypothetical protein